MSDFYNSIVSIANERVVTTDDFAPFLSAEVGLMSEANRAWTSWLLLDAGDLPDNDHDECVTEFFVRRIGFNGFVQIGAYYGRGIHRTWVAIWMQADELAIRMEAS